jgi:hypothetical protein
VTHFTVKKNTQAREVTCFAYGETSHLARECKNPKIEKVRPGKPKVRDRGKLELTVSWQS